MSLANIPRYSIRPGHYGAYSSALSALTCYQVYQKDIHLSPFKRRKCYRVQLKETDEALNIKFWLLKQKEIYTYFFHLYIYWRSFKRKRVKILRAKNTNKMKGFDETICGISKRKRERKTEYRKCSTVQKVERTGSQYTATVRIYALIIVGIESRSDLTFVDAILLSFNCWLDK